MTFRANTKPLTLPMIGRWLTDTDTEATFTFDPRDDLDMAELEIAWGPGPRQTQSWALQEADLEKLRDWLNTLIPRGGQP